MTATRNTVQKDIVYKTVSRMSNHPTADMIYENIKKEYGNISKATVYRILNHFVGQDEIRCVKVPNGADRYECVRKEHGHIRCIQCGELADVALPVGQELMDRVQKATDIEVIRCHFMFDGICEKCI